MMVTVPKTPHRATRTIEAAGLIIDRWRAEGYEFVTIDKLNK